MSYWISRFKSPARLTRRTPKAFFIATSSRRTSSLPIGVFGRAYALAGDLSKARKFYQDFLAMWKDADPDVPILVQARQEYAKLMAN
jgi:hypothetical protein